MKARVVAYFPLILILFHAIGLMLFLQGPDAASLSWLTILLSGTLIVIAENNLRKTAIVFGGIFILGYAIELIGTQTGYLFGNYTYGKALGIKLFGVPVIIGINWFATIAACASSARLFRMSVILQSGLAALLATLLDVVIEPVAMRCRFWSWNDDRVPVFNYICWFVFSLLFAYFYLRISSGRNQTAIALFVVWLLFFTVLNIL
jgi:bisanhydrobacterioruberin hydratase